MRGNAVEVAQLVNAQPQDVLELIRHPVPAVCGQRCQHFVDGVLLTKHAGGDFVNEPTVEVAQGSRCSIEGTVKRLAGANLLQNGTRSSSRCRTFGGVLLLHWR